MTVQELIDQLKKHPSDCTVVLSSGDYPSEAGSVYQTSKFDGYITPGFAAKRRDKVIVIAGERY